MQTTMFKRKLVTLRRFVDETFRRDSYPLPKNESGMYPTTKAPNGKLCCPVCGESNTWSLHDFITLECNSCFSFFSNYGGIGLKPLDRERTVDTLDKVNLNIPKLL